LESSLENNLSLSKEKSERIFSKSARSSIDKEEVKPIVPGQI
jgi:hypothetical protein